MFVRSLALLLLAALSALASASSLCIQGCCDHALKLSSKTLSLASNIDTVAIKLPHPEIPCCKCSDDSELQHDKSQRCVVMAP
jgi:hypothetical protein